MQDTSKNYLEAILLYFKLFKDVQVIQFDL